MRSARGIFLALTVGLSLVAACGPASAVPAATSTPSPTLDQSRGSRTLPADCGASFAYAAMGDSTVAGVGASGPTRSYVGLIFARLQARYPRAELSNLGVSGAVSADVVRDQLPRAVGLHPLLITLSVGPNDITGGLDIDQYGQNLDAVFRALSRDTRAVVVVNLMPDLALAPRFTADQQPVVAARTAAFNDVLGRRAAQYGIDTVDLYTSSQQEVPGHPELFAVDRYHPSDSGYAKWAEHVWPSVEAHIPPACRRAS